MNIRKYWTATAIALSFMTGLIVAATEVELGLEISTDLETWETVPITDQILRDGRIVQEVDEMQGFFRLRIQEPEPLPEIDINPDPHPNIPEGFTHIAAGSFEMGDAFGEGSETELPVHTVALSAYFMEKHQVTWAKWNEVRAWGLNNGYEFLNAGVGHADDHPVTGVSWYDAVKWCNARSEMEGLTPVYYTDTSFTLVYRQWDENITNDQVDWSANGYRLPTEAEWEKAARGRMQGLRFAWGNFISHNEANYRAGLTEQSYDLSFGANYHPEAGTVTPRTLPVGYFAPTGYGLYDMSGNAWDWIWDWHDDEYYANSPTTDPRGPEVGTARVIRGGSWLNHSLHQRVAYRSTTAPAGPTGSRGFRTVRNASN